MLPISRLLDGHPQHINRTARGRDAATPASRSALAAKRAALGVAVCEGERRSPPRASNAGAFGGQRFGTDESGRLGECGLG